MSKMKDDHLLITDHLGQTCFEDAIHVCNADGLSMLLSRVSLDIQQNVKDLLGKKLSQLQLSPEHHKVVQVAEAWIQGGMEALNSSGFLVWQNRKVQSNTQIQVDFALDCTKCGIRFEVLARSKKWKLENPKPYCPQCGSPESVHWV